MIKSLGQRLFEGGGIVSLGLSSFISNLTASISWMRPKARAALARQKALFDRAELSGIEWVLKLLKWKLGS